MRTFLLSMPIDNIEIGTRYRQLPLHCTLLQPFVTANDVRSLASGLTKVLQKHCPVMLKATDTALFGPNDNVPVHKVELTPEIKDLHQSIIALLEATNAQTKNPEWSGDGYQPHVSNLPNRTFEIGSQKLVEGVVLIEILDGFKLATDFLPLGG